MTVFLHSTKDMPSGDFDTWASIGESPRRLTPETMRPELGAELEDAFDRIAPRWFDLAKSLAQHPSADLAIAPSCATNISDLGVMLAWSDLVEGWAKAAENVLVICDDPWVFRHLAQAQGVTAGRAPDFSPLRLSLSLRGYAARIKAALSFAGASLRLKSQQKKITSAQAWLLAYGHPSSDADGGDGYFGDLMKTMPHLRRLLHVDCPPARARELGGDGRTVSLHAWGSPLFALFKLPFMRWTPHPSGPDHWLVRRAADLEGGTGQPAAIAWQKHCQERWLKKIKPPVVAWPWENHSWERAFVRSARTNGTATIGYQHSVVGQQMLNYAARSNVDGPESLPDKVLCSGPSTRDQVLAWGMPEDRLAIGGALRFGKKGSTVYDREAPVFVALPFDPTIAAELVAALKNIADRSRRFLVKQHPMSPLDFDDTETVERTDVLLGDHPRLSAVVFAASTVGLEALLLGFPTLRFRSQHSLVIDILPRGLKVAAAGSNNLQAALDNLPVPAPLERANVLADPDRSLWTHVLRKPSS